MCEYCEQKKPYFYKLLNEFLKLEIQRRYEYGKEKDIEKYLNNKGMSFKFKSNPAFFEDYTEEEKDEIFNKLNDMIHESFFTKFVKNDRSGN